MSKLDEKTKRKQKKTMMRKLGPMTTRTFVKNIPQDTLVNLHWNTRVMSRRAPVQQMRVWKTTIPFSYFRTMILTALKIFFYVRRRTYLFTRSIEPRSIARHWRFRQENIHWNQLIYAAWPSESWPVGLPSGLSVWVGYASCTSLLQGKRRSWSRLCGSPWFVCAGVERASREGSSYIYTSSTLTSRWHQRGQALWRTTGPPINLATFLFSILDSKRRLGTFTVFFGLILLILLSFLMALFYDWKVVREFELMVVGLSSPLSKSSFILFYSWCFCTPKAR